VAIGLNFTTKKMVWSVANGLRLLLHVNGHNCLAGKLPVGQNSGLMYHYHL